MKLFLSIILFFSLANPTVNPDKIMGKWYIKNNEGVVEIYKSGDKYYGKIVWVKIANDAYGYERKDVKNPDPALRNRPLLGTLTLIELNYVPSENHWHGNFYSPRNGQSANVIITLNDPNTMTVMGYVGSTFFSKTEIWRRKL